MTLTSTIGPNELSRHRLERVLELSKRRSGIQLPPSFVRWQWTAVSLRQRREKVMPKLPPTPLVTMLRGGHGGEVRLKLYLTITLLAAHPPFDISRPIASRTWAELLGLSEPDTNGARRIIDAFSWLDAHKFLHLKRQGGMPPLIYLRDPSGDGSEYSKPKMPYVTLPIGYWEQQWVTALSSTGTALLLILLELGGGKNRDAAQSVTTERRALYTLSDDSWTRATKELVEFGLLEVARASSRRDLEYGRQRNTYELFKRRLSEPIPGGVLEARARRGERERQKRHKVRSLRSDALGSLLS